MKLLIVDGEPDVAAGLAAWLVENGWDAPGVATTSDEAVEWINQNGKIHLLVSEVFLQPADGLTLRESVLPYFPKMKTIFMSAHDVSTHAARMEGCPFLSKPVTGDALDSAIRDLYEEKPAAPIVPQPVAVAPAPRAVPAAQPRAVVPRAVAAAPVPAASKPKTAAQPIQVAQPAPVARAVPQAKPAAAVATPGAVPSPTPVPKAAVASSQPAPVPVPAAQPRPVAVAGPRPVPAPVAAPKAVAAAAPRPVAAPAAVQASPVAAVAKSVPAAEMELPPDEVVGMTIGSYVVEAKIGLGSQGGIYRAMQTNMARHVRFYALDRERAQDAEEIQRFIANASVKANVAHPSIFAVYEAGEGSGIYYYSCEYVPCRSLRQLREAGIPLDENTALQTMKVAADVLSYFARENITHNIISENSILLDKNNRPRIANIAAYQSAEPFDQTAEMARLGSVIAGMLPETANQLGVRSLAHSLAAGEFTYPDWPSLAQAVAGLEPKVAPEDAYKLDAQERAAIRMVEEAKKRQRKSMLISTLISLCLLAAALGSVYWFLLRPKGANVRVFDRMIEIPAGEFIYGEGQKENLPAFYIDEFEVTIGQYAEFLKYLEDHPDEAAKFDHPNQPKGKSHVPKNWADEELATGPMFGYYQRAQKWGKFHDAPLDVNCPVFGVDWFDAYAYAKWKGHRLPTEKEWEKAARGTGGFKFPWGNDDQPKLANLGGDFNPNPEKGGEIDGHDRWSPVDAEKKDKSPFGVMGMAGNVSEWTDTYDQDPKMSSMKIPVIRGGNYKTTKPEDYILTKRVLLITDLDSGEALGFRTVSDTPPAKK